MEDQNLHYRHILLFYLKKGKNASQALNKLCSVYGKDAISLRSYQRWFEKFWSGNLSVENSSRTGRLTEIETDKIKVLFDENPYLTTQDIAGDLEISHTSVLNHIIHKIEKKNSKIIIFIKLVMSVDSTLGYRTPWPRPNWRIAPRSAIRWLDAKKIIHFWNLW